jgi:hypothetical protein
MKRLSTATVIMLVITMLVLVHSHGPDGTDDDMRAPTTSLVSSVGGGLSELESLARAVHHRRLAAASSSADCILSPEMTEGPYYWNNLFVRANLT